MYFKFKFAKEKQDERYVTEEYITEIETKYNFKFPEILKKWYLEHNYDDIKLCDFKRYGVPFCIDVIFPLNFDNKPMAFEKKSLFNIK